MSYRPILNINITNADGKSDALKSYRIINRISLLTLLLKIIKMKDKVIRVKFILETTPGYLRYGKIKRINVIVTENFNIGVFDEMVVNIPTTLIYNDFKPLHDISHEHGILRRLKQIFVDTNDNPVKINFLTKSN